MRKEGRSSTSRRALLSTSQHDPPLLLPRNVRVQTLGMSSGCRLVCSLAQNGPIAFAVVTFVFRTAFAQHRAAALFRTSQMHIVGQARLDSLKIAGVNNVLVPRGK